MPNFTKEAIKTSFLKLLNERPLNKITVKDIVEDCGINRNSFYYHFQNIPSLIEEIIADEVDKIVKEYPYIQSLGEAFHVASQFILKNKRAILHIYNSVNRDIFEHYLMNMCEYVVTTYADTLIGETKISEQDRKILIRYIKCSLFGICIDWMDNRLNDDIVEDLHRFLKVSQGIPQIILKQILSS
ncbi:MAG TPA: TetR/AcrR family transcriptional regulator [Candidatus Dorea intestinavium]|nr:TetR/AcrR family transcriptional regulator [Candidatus Dorea intestinavium]